MATKITTRVLADDAVTDAKIADVTLTTATQSASDNTTKIATTAYVTTAIANLADSAPSTLNTLNELAAALGDDANYATTTTNAIAAKAPLSNPTLTNITIPSANSDTVPRIRLDHPSVSGDASIDTFQDASGTYLTIGSNSYQAANSALTKFNTNEEANALRFDSGGSIQFYNASSSENLTERMRIGSSGGIGFGGTDTGSYGKFTFYQSSNTNGGGISVIDSGLARTGRLWTNGTNVYLSSGATGTGNLVLNEGGGNVGIGKVPSTWYFDVDSNDNYVASFDGSNNTGVVINSESGSGEIIGFSNSASSYNKIGIRGASGTGILVDTSNKVGIGCTPARDLHLQTEGSTNGFRIQSNDENLLFLGAAGSSGAASDDGYFALDAQGSNKIFMNGAASVGAVLDASGSTNSIRVPDGTTAQRPTGANGMIRYNTTDSKMEIYNGMWLPVKTEAPLAFQQASTHHQKWTIAADGQSAQAGSGYSAITVNLNFEGNFQLITKWHHTYMGVGIGYKAGITNANFTGESNDGAGPYGGGTTVDGFDSTVSYMGQYHWPIQSGGGNSILYYIKHQRVGNTISTHYSTNASSATSPSHSSWTQVQSATIASTDHCKPLWGEAHSGETVALTLLYNDITGGFNGS